VGLMRPASGVLTYPDVVFLKYEYGIFENIPEKCGVFVICRRLNEDIFILWVKDNRQRFLGRVSLRSIDAVDGGS